MGIEEICALMAISYGLLEFAHKSASKETNEWLSRWLKNLNPVEDNSWDSRFIQFFDGIYDSRSFSRKRILRSFLSSIIFSAIIGSLSIWLFPLEHFQSMGLNSKMQAFGNMLGMVLIANVIPDMISLNQTRWVSGLMLEVKDSFKKILYLILDLILTFVILYLVFFLVNLSLKLITPESDIQPFIHPFRTIYWGLKWSQWFFGVVVYTSLFTSIWIWLYLLGGLLIRATNTARSKIFKFLSYFDIDQAPLRVIGLVVALSVGITATAITIIW